MLFAGSEVDQCCLQQPKLCTVGAACSWVVNIIT